MPDLFGNNVASKAAALLSRGVDEPDDDDRPALHAMSLRLPTPTVARLAAMAHFAGCSRNAMSNMIFEAGIKAIYLETSPSVQAQIAEYMQDNFSDFL
jgi:hypothetical protein